MPHRDRLHVDDYPTLLVVEDDERIGKLLAQFLRSEQFNVDWVVSGEEAVDYIEKQPPDLVILDLMLPKMDGVEVCTTVRPYFSNSILMLTAHDGDIQEVTALNAGVDDFLNKPVRTHILLARINALLRRQHSPVPSQLSLNGLDIDRDRRTVEYAGKPVSLSDAEFELLWALASQAGTVVKREDLFRALRSKDYDGLDRSIDMRISKLRKKLAASAGDKEYIRTLRQLGYLFVRD